MGDLADGTPMSVSMVTIPEDATFSFSWPCGTLASESILLSELVAILEEQGHGDFVKAIRSSLFNSNTPVETLFMDKDAPELDSQEEERLQRGLAKFCIQISEGYPGVLDEEVSTGCATSMLAPVGVGKVMAAASEYLHDALSSGTLDPSSEELWKNLFRHTLSWTEVFGATTPGEQLTLEHRIDPEDGTKLLFLCDRGHGDAPELAIDDRLYGELQLLLNRPQVIEYMKKELSTCIWRLMKGAKAKVVGNQKSDPRCSCCGNFDFDAYHRLHSLDPGPPHPQLRGHGPLRDDIDQDALANFIPSRSVDELRDATYGKAPLDENLLDEKYGQSCLREGVLRERLQHALDLLAFEYVCGACQKPDEKQDSWLLPVDDGCASRGNATTAKWYAAKVAACEARRLYGSTGPQQLGLWQGATWPEITGPATPEALGPEWKSRAALLPDGLLSPTPSYTASSVVVYEVLQGLMESSVHPMPEGVSLSPPSSPPETGGYESDQTPDRPRSQPESPPTSSDDEEGRETRLDPSKVIPDGGFLLPSQLHNLCGAFVLTWAGRSQSSALLPDSAVERWNYAVTAINELSKHPYLLRDFHNAFHSKNEQWDRMTWWQALTLSGGRYETSEITKAFPGARNEPRSAAMCDQILEHVHRSYVEMGVGLLSLTPTDANEFPENWHAVEPWKAASVSHVAWIRLLSMARDGCRASRYAPSDWNTFSPEEFGAEVNRVLISDALAMNIHRDLSSQLMVTRTRIAAAVAKERAALPAAEQQLEVTSDPLQLPFLTRFSPGGKPPSHALLSSAPTSPPPSPPDSRPLSASLCEVLEDLLVGETPVARVWAADTCVYCAHRPAASDPVDDGRHDPHGRSLAEGGVRSHHTPPSIAAASLRGALLDGSVSESARDGRPPGSEPPSPPPSPPDSRPSSPSRNPDVRPDCEPMLQPLPRPMETRRLVDAFQTVLTLMGQHETTPPSTPTAALPSAELARRLEELVQKAQGLGRLCRSPLVSVEWKADQNTRRVPYHVEEDRNSSPPPVCYEYLLPNGNTTMEVTMFAAGYNKRRTDYAARFLLPMPEGRRQDCVVCHLWEVKNGRVDQQAWLLPTRKGDGSPCVRDITPALMESLTKWRVALQRLGGKRLPATCWPVVAPPPPPTLCCQPAGRSRRRCISGAPHGTLSTVLQAATRR